MYLHHVHSRFRAQALGSAAAAVWVSKAVGRPPFFAREYLLCSRYIRGISKNNQNNPFPRSGPSPRRYTCTVYPIVSRCLALCLQSVTRVSPKCMSIAQGSVSGMLTVYPGGLGGRKLYIFTNGTYWRPASIPKSY